jgi:ectoine hydroxylase-related dioxygenase (phytanoyl-CoA dioxygenase family)
MAGLIGELSNRVDESVNAAVEAGLLDPEDRFPEVSFAKRLALASRRCREFDWMWKRDFEDQKRITEGIFKLRTATALLDITESLIGGEILAHPQFNVRCKLPDQRETVVPWHQDLGYLNTEEAGDTLVVNFWIPLIPATIENGCMQVIPGTHRDGYISHHKLRAETMANFGIRDEDIPPGEIVSCEVGVGDVVLLNERVVHRSLPNNTDTVRWSVDTRYSQVGLPTGRSRVRGFLARSREHPDEVVRSCAEWRRVIQPA